MRILFWLISAAAILSSASITIDVCKIRSMEKELSALRKENAYLTSELSENRSDEPLVVRSGKIKDVVLPMSQAGKKAALVLYVPRENGRFSEIAVTGIEYRQNKLWLMAGDERFNEPSIAGQALDLDNYGWKR